MPKQTFLNLPEEKRETIINAAVEEFAEYGLENASTNRIVKTAALQKEVSTSILKISRMSSCI